MVNPSGVLDDLKNRKRRYLLKNLKEGGFSPVVSESVSALQWDLKEYPSKIWKETNGNYDSFDLLGHADSSIRKGHLKNALGFYLTVMLNERPLMYDANHKTGIPYEESREYAARKLNAVIKHMMDRSKTNLDPQDMEHLIHAQEMLEQYISSKGPDSVAKGKINPKYSKG